MSIPAARNRKERRALAKQRPAVAAERENERGIALGRMGRTREAKAAFRRAVAGVVR